MDAAERFSVYQWFVDGQYEAVSRFVPVDVALRQAAAICDGVNARVGNTTRVIITDGGDCIAWEWKHGEGVVFPKDERQSDR